MVTRTYRHPGIKTNLFDMYCDASELAQVLNNVNTASSVHIFNGCTLTAMDTNGDGTGVRTFIFSQGLNKWIER